MALLLICAWEHCGLRLNTAHCGSGLFIGHAVVVLAVSIGLELL